MWATRVLCCLLVVAAMPGVGAVVAGMEPSGPAGPSGDVTAGLDSRSPGTADDGRPALRQEQPVADGTVTRVRVHANGSARWSIRIRTRLENDSDVESYRAFQERFRNDTAQYLDSFRDRIRGTVASAADATGRPMNATGFTASTSIQQLPRRFGVVTYEFTWHGFARQEGDAVVVGDVFAGGFLLSEGDTLTLAAPPDHAVAGVEPEPDRRDDDRLTWQGARSFADGRPMARFADGQATDTGAADGPVTDGATDGGLPWYYPAGGLVLLAGALVAGVLYRRWHGDVGGDAAGGPAGGSSPPEPPLTDADRVRQLLAEADGQLKQKRVAEELDWSTSKTSRTLSSMEDDGAIERVRIGRENVVRLANED